MKTRDILTIAGAVCLAVGPAMMVNAPTPTLYWIGQILAAAGGALTGTRAVLK